MKGEQYEQHKANCTFPENPRDKPSDGVVAILSPPRMQGWDCTARYERHNVYGQCSCAAAAAGRRRRGGGGRTVSDIVKAVEKR